MTGAQAFFLAAQTGQRYALYHPAQGRPRGQVLLAHAFAEELNKTRRMTALQSRALASAGYAVLQIDLLGCGDSSGDFGDASWDAWLHDLALARAWLQAQMPEGAAVPLWLWGVRAGCLLAADLARTLAEPCHLLLWQPTFLTGSQQLQQFLRLRLAADLLAQAGAGAKGAMQALQDQVAAGQTLEIAGYALAPTLATGLARSALMPPVVPLGAAQLVWLEVAAAAREANQVGPAAARTVQAWQQAGWHVQARSVQGPAFWQTVDAEEAPGLLEATHAALTAHDSAARPARPPDAVPAAGAAEVDAVHATPCLESTLTLPCAGLALPAVLALPAPGGVVHALGVLVVVGGPQYRIGSHRQFVQLARRLAAQGYPVLRFDVRGMGDSPGEPRSFEDLNDDIAAGIDGLLKAVPTLRSVVLWGLCDGAAASLLYLHERADPRVAGLCLLNPWARSPQGLARTQIRHYYGARLLQPAFWRKLLRGGVGLRALRDLAGNVRQASARAAPAAAQPFQQRMAEAWRAFPGRILLLLSAQDLTAQEFAEHARTDPAWSGLLARANVQRDMLAEADHTLSTPQPRAQMELLTLQWLATLSASPAGGFRT
jgi:exosortase A-associated hydrolase 1/exosortase A-associated hydrolase 2